MQLDHSERPALSPRTRILDAASELFYRDGIRAVGIDTVIARAGVAKASLYHHFRTKDELTAAVLRRRDERWRKWFAQTVEARASSPSAQLPAIFDVLAEWFGTDDFRGCAFINAAAEFRDAGHPVRTAVKEHKRAVLDYLRHLAREAGVDEPNVCASALFLLMEGAIVTAYIEGDTWPADNAKGTATALLRAKITT
jgi:AcrR family transcriptional regulator